MKSEIKATLAYFSLFNYPLTAFEIHKWLYSAKPVSLLEVCQTVSEMTDLAKQDGFFFLPGQLAGGVAQRLQNQFDNQKKIMLAQRAARLVSWLPFWQMIAVTNTVAQENSKADSDIDWLVVVKARRLWTVRFLMTAWLALLGQWRHGRHVANKICLSFFVTEDNLDLSRLKLPSGDIYLTYWPTQIIPLLSAEQTWEKFLSSNFWVKRNLANFDFNYLAGDRRTLPLSFPSRLLRSLGEWSLRGRMGDFLERFLRRVQLAKMSQREARRNASETRSGVIINDQMLKFHEIDRRAEFHQRWSNSLTS